MSNQKYLPIAVFAHEFNNLLTGIRGLAELVLLELPQGHPNRPDLEQICRSTAHATKLTRQLFYDQAELAPDLALVRADPYQIQQVLVNLLINARDALLHGGRIVVETTGVVLDDLCDQAQVGVTDGPYVMLVVSDNRIGTEQETCDRGSEPFFTTKKAGELGWSFPPL